MPGMPETIQMRTHPEITPRPAAGVTQGKLRLLQDGPGRLIQGPGIDRGHRVAVGAENLCHQAIFMNDASCAVMPLDPELIQVCNAVG